MKMVLGIVRDVFLIMMGILFLLLILTPLTGYGSMVVQGGSMNPTLSEGELSFVRPADKNDLKVGDIIVYRYNGIRTIHRITAVEENGVRTKGDAEGLTEEVQMIPFGNIEGKHWFEIPAIGSFWPFLFNASPLELLALMAGVLLVGLKWSAITGKAEAFATMTWKKARPTLIGRNALPKRFRL